MVANSSRTRLDPDAQATIAERAFLAALGAGGLAAAGALARVADGRLTLSALVATPDGTKVVRETASGSMSDAVALGLAVAEKILAAGGDAIVKGAR